MTKVRKDVREVLRRHLADGWTVTRARRRSHLHIKDADAYPCSGARIFADADEIRAVVFPHHEPDTEGSGQ